MSGLRTHISMWNSHQGAKNSKEHTDLHGDWMDAFDTCKNHSLRMFCICDREHRPVAKHQ
jgi:hypothetical protein